MKHPCSTSAFIHLRIVAALGLCLAGLLLGVAVFAQPGKTTHAKFSRVA
ncbi:MAG: hypothetical protein M3032_12645 [Verrucomicrobiota bacterium]|nr:hypothetical protein [Verrucomicrobiota bacterium]